MVSFDWLWYLLCAMQYSYLIMQYFWGSLATSSLQGTEAERIWLITQDLICSKWGEHVTEPVVNKSSHLLPLIITVITLIIFNSAPLIRASLGVQSFMNATFTGYNADIQNDTRSSNYELCSGVGSSWQRKSELYWKRRIIFSLRVLGTCFWLAALFFVALCTSLWTMVLKTDGEPDKKKLHGVIDTCGKWVTCGRVSICKLLVIHSEVVVKGGRNQNTGRPPISRLKPGPVSTPWREPPEHSYLCVLRIRLLKCIDHVEDVCVRVVWPYSASQHSILWQVVPESRLSSKSNLVSVTEILSYGITCPGIEGRLNPWILLHFVSPKLYLPLNWQHKWPPSVSQIALTDTLETCFCESLCVCLTAGTQRNRGTGHPAEGVQWE